jgi:hypothetical protein
MVRVVQSLVWSVLYWSLLSKNLTMSGCRLAQGTVQNQMQTITVRGALYTPITHIPDHIAHFPGMIALQSFFLLMSASYYYFYIGFWPVPTVGYFLSFYHVS